MIRMGIDASTVCTGYCIFEDKDLKTYGKISLNADIQWRDRIIDMVKQLKELIQLHNVEQICVEVPIKTIKNVITLERLFTLQGAIIGVTATMGVEVVPVEVSQWRKQLHLMKGIKAQDKKEERKILKQRSIELANQLYNLDLVYKSPDSKFNDDDISDAILICHSVINRH